MKQDYGNFNYSFTIHYDVEIEFTLYIPKNDGSNKHVIETQSVTLEKVYMGKFPHNDTIRFMYFKRNGTASQKKYGRRP